MLYVCVIISNGSKHSSIKPSCQSMVWIQTSAPEHSSGYKSQNLCALIYTQSKYAKLSGNTDPTSESVKRKGFHCSFIP